MKLFVPIAIIFILSASLASTEIMEGYVKQVISGNTILLSTGEVAKYIGIRLPKFYAESRNEDSAYEFNKRLVEGKTVKLEFDEQKKSAEGYLLAYVYSGDLFVNAEIIQLGYGLIEVCSPNTKYAEHLIKLEKEARSARRGIWSEPNLISMDVPNIRSIEERMAVIESKVDELSTKLDQLIKIADRLQPQPKDTHDVSAIARDFKTSKSEKINVNLEQKEANTVYATKSGKKYHKLGCRFLVGETTSMTIQEARQKGLEPCKLCFPEKESKMK